MKYYKCLTEDHTGRQSNEKWPPIGVWTTWKPIDKCLSGYHVCKKDFLCLWLDVKIFEVEVQGVQCLDSQYVGHRARLVKQLIWTEEQARNYTIDCAEYLGVKEKYIIAARKGLIEPLEKELWAETYCLSMDAYMGAHNISRCITDIDWMTRRLNEDIC